MAYKDVVREMFAKHKGKPPKEIMRMASAEWQKMKGGKSAKSAKGGGMFGDIGHGVDSVASLFGLGLEPKAVARRGRPRGGGVSAGDVSAGGLFGNIGSGVDSVASLFGLGLERPAYAGALRRKYPNENPTPNLPARNVSTRKAYGGNQKLLLGKVGRGRESGAIVERGSGVSAGGVSGGSFLDSLKMLPLMAMI